MMRRAVESVPPHYLARYFEMVNGRYVFHKKTCGVPSYSAATIWSRMHRYPASTYWCAATR